MRLLIIEDERTLCDAVSKSLEKDGFEVDVCYTGAEALEKTGTDKYDLIISNPPFFENNRTAEHNGRNIARQTLTLTHTELLESASRLLTEQGSLAVILPEQATEKFIYLAWEKGIRLVHRTDVLTIPGKLPKRALLQFSRKRTEPERSDTLTLCDAHGNKTPEYSMLTKDFYL